MIKPWPMRFERLKDPIAPRKVFLARMLGNAAIVLGLIAASLGVGMWGYHGFERMSWIDAFANASMILSGMGPLGELKTAGGKLFAGAYAIYSGLFLIIAAGLLLAPPLHRFLHELHLDDDDETHAAPHEAAEPAPAKRPTAKHPAAKPPAVRRR
jgi:hypothetical protein